MSEELERVYIINLGKVLLSQPQHRSTRAINMIREFARRHMKTQNVKIDEDLARQVWSRGARSPPRKLRVRMHKTDMGHILVSKYDEPLESESEGYNRPAVGDSSGPAAVTASAGTMGMLPSLPEPSATDTEEPESSEPPAAQDSSEPATLQDEDDSAADTAAASSEDSSKTKNP